ncbi:hypothetical protein [Massilia sp. erpn]|uniref:hypothetical protein n=1 Tax=Massilia sp. erpn TaxID=2738142 RepID=UPI0021070ACB|nr:hypothetical protein [Massilia sp. erpn]UTY57391.1 hypothetical protein HPQ68_09405 [Massilia sp. erpn]
MFSFESWMQQQGLSESSVKKYGSAVSGPLTAWANANSVLSGSLTDIGDLSAFESISSAVRKLPIFIERDSTGHGMYSAALAKFAEYLRLDRPNAAIGSLDVLGDTWVQTARRMVKTAQQTANSSNGQEVLQTIKNKNNAFGSPEQFSQYVADMIKRQNYRCAISGLLIQPDGLQSSDDEMKASLDRIDSSGHYEQGNLQVVCRFINRWKSSDPNAQFLRLMDALREHWHLEKQSKQYK